MNITEIRTEIEHQAWIRLLNDSNVLEREQLCSVSYEHGKLQLISNGQCMMFKCTQTREENDIAIQFAKGYSALASVTNIAANGTYLVRIVYIHGGTINLSNIDLALDANTLEQAKKLKVGNDFKEISQALKSKFMFRFDSNSKDYYAFAYLSQVAYDEIKQIEHLEKKALNSDDAVERVPFKEPALTNNMVLIGEGIQLAVGEYNIGEDTYLGCKRLVEKSRKEVNKAIRLIKINLGFSDIDNPVVLEAYAKQQMETLSNQEQGYLNTWDKYGDEEGNFLLKKARWINYISYTNFELYKDGSSIEVFVNKDYRKQLKSGDSLELISTDPEYLVDIDMTWEQYSKTQFENYKQKNGLNSGIEWGEFKSQNKTSNDSEQTDKSNSRNIKQQKNNESLIIDIKKVNQHSLVLGVDFLPDNAKLIYSIMGDQVQVERRMTARERISQGTSAMPLLGLIIEEDGVVPQRKKANKIKPLTNHVESKIFPEHPPTAMQKIAIECALNTPDICIIQGPPGTGKTTVIAAIIERLNEISDKKEGVQGDILISGYQHDAVDNVLSRLSVNSLPSVKFGQKNGEELNASSSDSKIDFWRHNVAQDVRNVNPELSLSTNYDLLHRFYQNYLSAPGTHKALRLLKLGLDAVTDFGPQSLSVRCKALSDELVEQSRPKDQSELRCVRALRITHNAFLDDGPARASVLLNKFSDQLSESDSSLLKKAITWEKGNNLDFLDELKQLKKNLLARFREEIRLNTSKVRQDVVELIQGCLAQLESSTSIKDPQNKILSNYLFELENNPLGIKKAISEYNLVYGATTGQSEGKLLRKVKVGGKGAIIFDSVIIDEAARAAPRDLMIPMVQAENRIILVGDHRQLPHMVEDKIVEALKDEDGDNKIYEEHIKHSMFQYLFNRLKKLEKQDGITRTITLDAQFRSHRLLGEFASDTFYQPHGEAYRSDLPDSLFSHQLKGIKKQAAVWVDVPHYSGKEEKDASKSTYRTAEAKKIAEKLSQWINSEEGKTLSFGVISFYKAQVREIFKELVKNGITEKNGDEYQICEQYKMLRDKTGKPIEERLRIGTVDSFQGMEFDIVLLSVVRSCDKQTLNNESIKQHSIFGHLMSINRLCVSMTRQKRALITFGDKAFVSSDRAKNAIPQVESYLQLCDNSGLVIGDKNKKVEVD
ncbi:AAA family ATPase [Pseudoalteromonas sp. SG44-1]|uniref:AAA domain-containing protein n=4 Tax=Bacteria TaxID=2 RepID=UPI0016030FE5|nr:MULTISPECIES: AAA domain-containing protein [unclassified Pseudoalteromonas]MBB1419216.1 AAA family ATPase [Pseudoalteromonas sp. SG44-1]MBB1478039.1 AAA family ATPase [Pseudoalteromonas sp. SG41-2]